MSNKNDIQEMLVSMGFEPKYVARAFKVYEKNYGHSYNTEVMTEIIVRLQNKDNKLKAKRSQSLNISSNPQCICGLYLQQLTASSCHDGSNGIPCNECLVNINGNESVYHCAAKQSAAHGVGYDLCINCANKTSGFRNKHIDEWSCKELQAWIISLNIGNENEKTLITAISEQEISGGDFNSMEEVADVMDSFEMKVGPAVRVFTALKKLRTDGIDNNIDNEESLLPLLSDIPNDEQERKVNQQQYTDDIFDQQYTDDIFDQQYTDDIFEQIVDVPMTKGIDGWDCNKLQQWISKLNLPKNYVRKVCDAIREQEITGEDFNSIGEAQEIMDSFQIGKVPAKKIFAELQKLRDNLTDENISIMDDIDEDNNVNHDNINQVDVVKNLVITPDIDDNVKDKKKGKHKMKEELDFDPPKPKEERKQEVTDKQQSVEESSEIISGNDNMSSVSYKNKSVQNWSNQDLSDWIQTIGLRPQWLQILVDLIKSKGCKGNDWFELNNFKELAKYMDIKQPMLANRTFREFKKAKKKYVNNISHEANASMSVVKKHKRVKSLPPTRPLPQKPAKETVKIVTAQKDISEWSCKELKQWIRTLKLRKKDEKKIIEAISEQAVCGEDFNSIEEAVDIRDSFEVSKRCAKKILSALQNVRTNTK